MKKKKKEKKNPYKYITYIPRARGEETGRERKKKTALGDAAARSENNARARRLILEARYGARDSGNPGIFGGRETRASV